MDDIERNVIDAFLNAFALSLLKGFILCLSVGTRVLQTNGISLCNCEYAIVAASRLLLQDDKLTMSILLLFVAEAHDVAMSRYECHVLCVIIELIITTARVDIF